MKEKDKGFEEFMMLKQIVELSKEMILRDGEMTPTIIAKTNQQIVVGQIHNFAETFEGRAQQIRNAGFALGQQKEVGELDQVFFVSEAWMGDPASKVRPSEDPNRKEILVIMQFRVKEEQNDGVILEMIRDKKGKLTALKQIEFPSEKEIKAESPLIKAFIAGFRLGIRTNPN